MADPVCYSFMEGERGEGMRYICISMHVIHSCLASVSYNRTPVPCLCTDETGARSLGGTETEKGELHSPRGHII